MKIQSVDYLYNYSIFGSSITKDLKFALTKESSCLLERLAVCLSLNEPALIVGETGTGKTTTIQLLANHTGHKLVVINMNQQSDSSDLLGGYVMANISGFECSIFCESDLNVYRVECILVDAFISGINQLISNRRSCLCEKSSKSSFVRYSTFSRTRNS